MTRLALVQRSEEWQEARRELITATDIPVLLGLSPYKCEADLADEKNGAEQAEPSVRMKIGQALESLILEEYEVATGCRAVRYHQMVAHGEHSWAAASPDARRLGERRLVELKWTTSRNRFADGLPQDIEAQVAWQLGCSGFPTADVAVLTPDGLLPVMGVAFDAGLFANLITVAQDFRSRLVAGGPFAKDKARLSRDHPADDGSELLADNEIAAAVAALIDARASRKRLEESEERLETQIKTRMADAAVLTGPGWHITWKRTKDRTETDWKSLSVGLLETLPETERDALVGLHTTVRPGFRPFRVVVDKED